MNSIHPDDFARDLTPGQALARELRGVERHIEGLKKSIQAWRDDIAAAEMAITLEAERAEQYRAALLRINVGALTVDG